MSSWGEEVDGHYFFFLIKFIYLFISTQSTTLQFTLLTQFYLHYWQKGIEMDYITIQYLNYLQYGPYTSYNTVQLQFFFSP